MWSDVVDLRDFYASSLGRTARRMIARGLRHFWPDVRGLSVLGLGYATPFLAAFRGEAERVVAAMPAAQGVMHWPADEPSLTTLADELALPFGHQAFDRVLLVHGLECAEQTRPMLREIWRVLTDGGRLVVVAPNRRGLWARFDYTPFGVGRPYTPAQLSRGLRDCLFTPYQTRPALFVPPVPSRMLLSSATAWEQVGARWFSRFAGVSLCEATKQIYAGHLAAPAPARRVYVPVATR